MENNTNTVSTSDAPVPSYHEIFAEIGRQFQARKALLFKRVLLITWPVLLFLIGGYFMKNSSFYSTLTDPQRLKFAWFVGVYVVLAMLYTAIVSFVFTIEKQIWLDSFFDKKNLTSKQSWKIAGRLFWPALWFRIRLWFRYFTIPVLVVLVMIFITIKSAFLTTTTSSHYDVVLVSSVVALVVFCIALIIYGYYIRTKLRYGWFVFLDTWGVTDPFGTAIEEMNKLNEVSRSETFKKSLVAAIGTDTVRGVVNVAIGAMTRVISGLGGAGGKMLGGLVNVYTRELNRQVTDLANISAQYVLYRFAHKQVYGTEQEVNENIYKLGE